MKNILLILIFPISFAGFCDFVDYWIIQVNDSVIYNSNEDNNSWRNLYTLRFSDLKLSKNDTLKIIYQTDTPCSDCTYNLLLTDLKMNKKKLYEKKGLSTFEITFEDFKLLKSKSTEFIYFRSDQKYLRKIMRIE